MSEAKENDQEILVTGRNSRHESAQAYLGSTARQVFVKTDIPVLFVSSVFPVTRGLRRLLICTAGGEPGKGDVQFGGRIARLTRAAVTVFHAYRPDAPENELERIKRYTAQAKHTLITLGVDCKLHLTRGPALENILAEAESRDYGLIVLGAPAPRDPQRLVWTDLTIQVLTNTDLPVLVVPMTG